jgi:HSP20 family molecular chaperone IbpA
MFFAATPSHLRRNVYANAGRSMEQFLNDTVQSVRQPQSSYTQDETSFTLSLDMPGIAKDQLSIAIEDSIVRISTKEGAPRNYRTAYELPQLLDTTQSEAKLENGVLTLKLAKKVPVKNVTELTIQ